MSGRLDLTRVDLCFTKCCDKVRIVWESHATRVPAAPSAHCSCMCMHACAAFALAGLCFATCFCTGNGLPAQVKSTAVHAACSVTHSELQCR